MAALPPVLLNKPVAPSYGRRATGAGNSRAICRNPKGRKQRRIRNQGVRAREGSAGITIT
ncbi:MAG TPA: hypothetical protein P5228_01330 [Bacteroidales bacterium]|nr:hypothetical protein [Bacteroidales bacterium]HRZ48175.1 hypothetical protein [Bacteroidales bacterium]